MMPAHVALWDGSLPRTPNGKIDRQALQPSLAAFFVKKRNEFCSKVQPRATDAIRDRRQLSANRRNAADMAGPFCAVLAAVR
jgi:hypothetical protein